MKKITESVSILIMAFHISHSSYFKIFAFLSRFAVDHNRYFTGIKLLWVGIVTFDHAWLLFLDCHLFLQPHLLPQEQEQIDTINVF
jgi:hypothetical protein